MTGTRRRATGLLAGLATASLLISAPAAASHDGWMASPGTTVDGDTLVLDTTNEAETPAGTSYEHTNLGVEITDGDTISFDYVLEGAVCGGGQPRLFIEVGGTYINTWDGNAEGDCGQLVEDMGETEGTVVLTYQGDGGTIGHAGIVFDNPSDRGVAHITNVQIGDYTLVLDHDDENGDPTTKDDCKDGGWEDYGFRNQGQCIRFVNTGQDSR